MRLLRSALFLVMTMPLAGCFFFLPKTTEGVSQVCSATTYGQTTRIIDKMSPDFKARGTDHPVYFDRRDLEGARYLMYGKRGLRMGDAPCLPGDRDAPG